MLLRAPYTALVLACAFLAGAPPRSIAAEEITPVQRQAIEAIIHDYLMQNPDVLIEALRAAEDKASRDADVKAALVLKDRRREVFDYRCPYCKQVQPSLQALLDQDPKLRFIYKEMPVLGAPSVVAAHAALAARLQGKYEAFHAAMMATKGQITNDVVYQVAASVGLDVDRLKRDMEAPDIDQAVKSNLALATALDIRGTPGFIIGDHIVPGAIDLDALKSMIAEARKG